MIGTETRIETNKDGAAAVETGVKKRLMAAMDAGFARTQQVIAEEATDRGTLLQSGVPPFEREDGSIVFGYNAEYARFVDKGTRPHWPPIQPLLGWARRVLGDESAAYAVQQKIAEEGTEPVHFIRDGVQAVTAHLQARGIKDAIVEEL